MQLTIPLWIIAIGVAWMASKPWREQRRKDRAYRRGMELLYGHPQPAPMPSVPPAPPRRPRAEVIDDWKRGMAVILGVIACTAPLMAAWGWHH
jgi:hypothetical protein